MVDVTPVTPGLPPEPPLKKSERTADKDAFHKEMHRRVEKVSETDPENKKKRKRQEEADEEDETQPTQGPTTPAEHVTPFSLTQGVKKASPLDMQKGSEISPLASAQRTSPPSEKVSPPSQSPLMGAAPSADEIEDDSGFFEETAFMETTEEEEPASTGYSSAPAPEDTLYSPPEESVAPAPLPQEQAPLPVQEAQQSPRSDESTSPTTSKKKKGSASKKSATPAPPKESKKPQLAPPPPEPTQGVTAEEMEQQQQILETKGAGVEETGGFFEQFLDEKDKGLKKEGSIPPSEKEGEASVPLIAPLPPSDYIEKEKKEEEEIAATSGIGTSTPGMELPPPLPEAAPAGVNNPYTNLHPEVMDLFDKMVGTMTVMSYSGITETEVTLNTPKFASSVFFGSQIIIQEYSSAPHSFNIQLNGSPEALALFEGNADELMAAFQYGNYNFRVNRLETGLVGQKPLIKRKRPASRNKEDQRYQ